MQNVAYRLAFLAVLGGVILFALADQGDGLYTSLGTTLLIGGLVLAATGKGIDLLGYVHEGASEPPDRD